MVGCNINLINVFVNQVFNHLVFLKGKGSDLSISLNNFCGLLFFIQLSSTPAILYLIYLLSTCQHLGIICDLQVEIFPMILLYLKCHVHIQFGEGVIGLLNIKMYVIKIYQLYENVSLSIPFQDLQSYIYFPQQIFISGLRQKV